MPPIPIMRRVYMAKKLVCTKPAFENPMDCGACAFCTYSKEVEDNVKYSHHLPKAKVLGCTCSEYDYHDLEGQEVEIAYHNLHDTEFCLVRDAKGRYRVISNTDLEEDII